MAELLIPENLRSYLSDEQFKNAVAATLKHGKCSTSLIQRILGVGYGKAAMLIDAMEAMGIISALDGQNPRKPLITSEEWNQALESFSSSPAPACDTIAVLLADGFEEIEALTPVDMLRRAGLNVKTVAIGAKIAVGSHSIPVVCDMEAREVDPRCLCAVILPGGMPGSLNLDASEHTDKFINAVNENGGRLAAICAAPLVLGRRGLLDGKEAICYPGFEGELKGAKISERSVVTDGNITTAKGMGVALEFSHELVRLLCDEKKAADLRAAIMED